jgi:hypothetical protein
MKTTITTIAILALTASAALATPKPTTGNNTNTNQNVNHNSATAVAGASANAAAIAAQQQAQIQGQAQGQNQTASANNSNRVSSSNAVSNDINFEAGVGGIAVAAASCTNGMSVGIPGASLGYSFSDKECKIIAEAQALAALGMMAEARTHLTHIARINQSVRANQAPVTIGSAVSFSAAVPMEPAQLSYIKCDLDTTVSPPHLTVQPRTDELAAQARVDCLAAHGF